MILWLTSGLLYQVYKPDYKCIEIKSNGTSTARRRKHVVEHTRWITFAADF